MGLFGRKRTSRTGSAGSAGSTGSTGSTGSAGPPQRGDCACSEHIEELLELPVPLVHEVRDEVGEESISVGDLVEMTALGVDPAPQRYFFDPRSGRQDDGPYHWTIWYGDEARGCYDDEASLQLDESLDAQPGVELVAWEDREVIHVGAPTLCADGVLAAAARALMDPRVRLDEG